MQLTPGEYDDLPQEAKDALASVVRHPMHDYKSTPFRKRFGPFLNGELTADPVTRQIVGYGTGGPSAPP